MRSFASALALVVYSAVPWGGEFVVGDQYLVRCQEGTAVVSLSPTDVSAECDEEKTPTTYDDADYGIEVVLEESTATLSVRSGTTTSALLIETDDGVAASAVPLKFDDIGLANMTNLGSLYFINIDFADPDVMLAVSSSLNRLEVSGSNLQDLSLDVPRDSDLATVVLSDTLNKIPRLLYERNYSSLLDVKEPLTLDISEPQILNTTEYATLLHNVGNLSSLSDDLKLSPDCNDGTTDSVCVSDVIEDTSDSGSRSPSSSAKSDTNGDSTGETDSSSPDGDAIDGDKNTATIVTIIAAAVIVAAICATYLVIRYRRRSRKSSGAENTQTLIASVETPSNRHDKPIVQVQHTPDQLAHPRPWDDDVIVKARIPSDKVELGAVMSRGAFGEVYRGSYRGQQVAVKMLHPSMRHETNHIEIFFHEIKIMATLEHPNIVQFVGVAWDSLTEVCAVSELMDGGDLRTLLMEYHENRKPQGFDSVKIKIAADVAHALTYLHSFQPVVLHRDLKSRNILLSADRKTAKVTDFGTSRERADITMTVGIGTSLWMAPEMIMGGRYDDKADIFSFGVVLSELATHELPYTQATKATSGAPMSVAAIMQAVVSGHLHLDFATSAPHSSPEIVDLACACTSFDPSTRPAAAMVAWKLIQILRNMTD